MKIISHFHGCLVNGKIILKPLDDKDNYIINKLFTNKAERENRTKKEILLRCEINAPYQHRTFKQNNAVWVLVGIIFESMENRRGTHEELYDIYSSLLEEYADRKPSKINNKLRIVHLSEMNTEQCGRFIDSILNYIASTCDLNYDLQTDVRKFIYEWEEWKSRPENEFEEFKSIQELKEKVNYSEASGRGGNLHLHHIVSRGANPGAIDKAWNIMVLTEDEHNFFHQQCKNWDEFLEVYPHLRNKVETAYKKASLLDKENNSLLIDNLVNQAME